MRDFIVHHSIYNPLQRGRNTLNQFVVSNNQRMNDIPRNIKNPIFCRYGNDDGFTVLDFSSYSFNQLRFITISSNSFKNVREFVLDGLEKLESVKIGWGNFRISDEEREDGICQITNCPNLRELDIGNASFGYFKKFELSNVNSLQSIQFGDECFEYADNCILKGE